MSANWVVSKLTGHSDLGNCVVLSIEQSKDGYGRGAQYKHYGLSEKDALILAEEILNAVSGK